MKKRCGDRPGTCSFSQAPLWGSVPIFLSEKWERILNSESTKQMALEHVIAIEARQSSSLTVLGREIASSALTALLALTF